MEKYTADFKCYNCGNFQQLTINSGKTVRDFLLENDKPKCIKCGCETLTHITIERIGDNIK